MKKVRTNLILIDNTRHGKHIMHVIGHELVRTIIIWSIRGNSCFYFVVPPPCSLFPLFFQCLGAFYPFFILFLKRSGFLFPFRLIQRYFYRLAIIKGMGNFNADWLAGPTINDAERMWKRIVAALKMLILRAVGLQIRPSRGAISAANSAHGLRWESRGAFRLGKGCI